MGTQVQGIAVHIGARIAALGGPSDVLVSSTVKDLVAAPVSRSRTPGSINSRACPTAGTYTVANERVAKG